MRYDAMAAGMWVLFGGSFRKQLSAQLGFDEKMAEGIASKAKIEYGNLIGKLPEFERGDRFKTNIVSCAMLSAFLLSMPKLPDTQKVVDYYRK